MKVKLIIVCVIFAVLPIAMLGACGGTDADNGGEVGDAPTIETIGGTGSDGVVLDTLLVTGTNFDETMDVYLIGSAETETLSYTLESATKFTAALPIDIEPGDFDLEVQNDFGKATAPLSLLQGEPGPQGPEGPQGPAGEPGITVEHYYSCPGSSDLDPTADELLGLHATIYEFSDGSMFIACESQIFYSATLFWDCSTAVAFVPGNLVESMGYIACIPMYVNGSYTPSSNAIRWVVNADPGVYEDVACSTVY